MDILIAACNFVLSSLCVVDQLVAAVKILKGRGRAGCVPDFKSYRTVISDSEEHFEALGLLKRMAKSGVNPRTRNHCEIIGRTTSRKGNMESLTFFISWRQFYPVGFEL